MTTGGPTSSRRSSPSAARRTARSAPARTRSRGDRRMGGDRAVAPVGRLDDHPLGPRQPGLDLVGERVVTGHEPDRDAPRSEGQGVEPVLAGRPSIEPGLDRRLAVGVGDRPARVPGPGVIADEQGHIEGRRAVRPGLRPGDHRPGLLALEHPGRRMEVGGQQVVHGPVAVVDQDVGRAAGQGSLDRGIRLGDHELDRDRVAHVLRVRRVRVTDPADALHVDADVDPHRASSGPERAGCPIQTCPSANRSAFQIGARAFVSSIA